jgi:hypothetical protein
MSHFVRPKRPRNRTAPDATYDKTKIVSIIGNKAPILLHSVLKEIHECTAVGSERGASGLCGGRPPRDATTDLSDVQPGPDDRARLHPRRVDTVCPGCDYWRQLDLAAPRE